MSEVQSVFYDINEIYAHLAEETEGYGKEKYVRGHKIINTNRVLFVVKITGYMYNLVLCSRLSLGIYDQCYNYKTEEEAMKGMEGWNDVESEPTGWFRHPHTGRRRQYFPDGNFMEWIQP